MVGGRKEIFERNRAVLESLGSLVAYIGDHGSGQAMKLCNNLVVAATMAAIAEACAVIARQGIDPSRAYEVLMRSTGDSRVLRMRFPISGVRPEHPASDGYRPLFRLDLLAKDLDLALDLAKESGVTAAVAERAAEAYASARDAGFGALDYSAVYRMVAPAP
jgi:3-hydroxyisobutyrate dehydrogenase